MAIAYVQSSKANTAGATSLGASLTGVVAGNTLIFAIATGLAGTSVTSVNGGGATWAIVAGRQFQSGAGGTEIWVGVGGTGGSITVTGNFSASVLASVVLAEYSGLDASSPFDVSASAGGSSSTAASGSTATTAVADESIVGLISDGAAPYTPEVLSPVWDRRQSTAFITEYFDRIVSSTGTYAMNATLNSSTAWTSCVATFKIAAGGGAVVKDIISMGIVPFAR